MTTTNVLERVLPAIRPFAAALLLGLAACGPGSGGTGTGPGSNSSAIPGEPSAGVPPSDGGQPLPGSCSCDGLHLQADNDRVELVMGCGRFVFIGRWYADANTPALLPGSLVNPSTGEAIAVSLRLEFSGPPDNSPSATVTVLDEAGHALVGPILLLREVVPLTAPVPTCLPS